VKKELMISAVVLVGAVGIAAVGLGAKSSGQAETVKIRAIPVSRTVSIGEAQTYWGVELVGVSESVQILGVDVNRGNCKVSSQIFGVDPELAPADVREQLGLKYPFTLKYGETKKLDSSNCKQILEVKIRTDKGVYGFSPGK
jgi:hypothetical protein